MKNYLESKKILIIFLIILILPIFYYVYSGESEKRANLEYRCYQEGKIKEEYFKKRDYGDERNISLPPEFKYDHKNNRCLYSYTSYYFSPEGDIDSAYIYSLYDNSIVASYVKINEKLMSGDFNEWSSVHRVYFE